MLRTTAISATTSALFLLQLGPGAATATQLDSASVSPDVTVVLAGSTTDDEDVAVDDLVGGVVPASLGSLPAGTDLTAYTLLPGGDFDQRPDLDGVPK